MELAFRTDVFPDAAEIRRKVFMEEQGFQNEFDAVDEDERTIHLSAYRDGQLIGCARVFPSALEPGLETVGGRWVFGRLAVLPQHRGGRAGSRILAKAEQLAADAGATEIHLHAQCSAQPLYVRAGYEAYGPIEYDEHVEHQWMMKRL